MDEELRILVCILMNRLDNRVEIAHEEVAEARRRLADYETVYTAYPTSLLATETFTVEMRQRSRVVISG